MRNHGRLGWATASIVASGGLLACVGGGGGLSDGMATWDPASSSFERAEDGRERAPGFLENAPGSEGAVGASAEHAPGAQGGGGAAAFDCSGTFTCRESGDDDTSTLRLQSSDGVCSVAGSNLAVVLGSDGSLSLNGKKVGTWSATADGFTAVTDEGTVTCTRGGSQSRNTEPPRRGEDAPPSSSSSSSGSAGGGSVPPPVDDGG